MRSAYLSAQRRRSESDCPSLLTTSASKLAKLTDLRDKGVLTEAEFAKLKAELIA